jgi:transcriptional regulator with XRE-family HTH domain
MKQDPEHKQRVGARLARARKNVDLTQTDAGNACDVSKQTVSGWESGQNYPDLGQLSRLCRLYRVAADEILFDREVLSSRAMELAQRLDAIDDPGMRLFAFANVESMVFNAEEALRQGRKDDGQATSAKG